MARGLAAAALPPRGAARSGAERRGRYPLGQGAARSGSRLLRRRADAADPRAAEGACQPTPGQRRANLLQQPALAVGALAAAAGGRRRGGRRGECDGGERAGPGGGRGCGAGHDRPRPDHDADGRVQAADAALCGRVTRRVRLRVHHPPAGGRTRLLALVPDHAADEPAIRTPDGVCKRALAPALCTRRRPIHGRVLCGWRRRRCPRRRPH
mmetsp:Transcript_16111/g.52099  ORF Transcript_16111/g.52099 Transcript_16111/m.52099 type:complete len:211 (-) Transcript_16111:81-713(-)